MTDRDRILIKQIAGSYIPGEEMALYGSIQNYRRHERHEGRDISFYKAAREWNEKVFLPIISILRNDAAISMALGHDIKAAFFASLYATESNGFRIDEETIRREAMEKAHGFRALISRLIA